MLTNEIIRELKANRTEGKARMFLSKDTQKFLKENNDIEVDSLLYNGTWQRGNLGVYTGSIYSLPPDYPEIPVVTEGWVEIPVVPTSGLVVLMGHFRCTWNRAHTVCIGSLLSHFGGYRWDDGSVTLVIQGYSEHTLTPNVNRWVKPATPVALRFWCTDVQKFKAAQTQS